MKIIPCKFHGWSEKFNSRKREIQQQYFNILQLILFHGFVDGLFISGLRKPVLCTQNVPFRVLSLSVCGIKSLLP